MLRSSVFIAALSLAGTLLSFVNQLVIARLFGASFHMDGYLVATSIPLLVSGTILALLSYSMVPVLISERSESKRYRNFTGLMLLILTGLSVVIAGAGYVISPRLIETFGASLLPEARNEGILIARISWITAGISPLVGHLTAMHNASKRFVLPALTGILPYLLMILSGVVFGPSVGISAIAWGLLLGTALVLPLLLPKTFTEMNLSSECLGSWKKVVSFLSKTPLVMLAMFCFTFYQTIDSFWAPRLGAGNLAYLGYCQRILIAAGALVISGPSVVLVPRLSESIVAGKHMAFLHDLGRAQRMVLSLSAPLALVISLLATPVVELLFQRGAFDANATRGVVSVLPLMLTGMVAMLSVAISFRALFAKHDIVHAALLGSASALTYFFLSGFLSDLFAVRGIALAYATSWWMIFSAALLMLWKRSKGLLFSLENGLFLKHLLIALSLSAISLVLLRALLIRPLQEVGFVSLFFRIALAASGASLVFLVVSVKIFRSADVEYILCMLLERVPRVRRFWQRSHPNGSC